MINQKEITINWLKQISKENRNVDLILVEKVIRALLLLEGLVKLKLPFVFKGGTALMLHFNSTKRLSIDIDIVMPNDIDNLNTILNKIVKKQGFVRYELHHRTSMSKINKKHYKFFYVPIYKTLKDEEFVLLDVHFEKINYSKIISVPIKSVFTPISKKPLLVNVPGLEDILGDKLTAFSPNTTGIPYYKNEISMSMEIIKQLYDIGNLFDVVSDINIIKSTFNKFAKQELIYRNFLELSEDDVLEDIYQTALCIVSRGKEGKGNFKELMKGIQRIKNFIISESFHIENAITFASKIAYLSVLIKYNNITFEKFNDSFQIKKWIINYPSGNKLNKLKKSNPEAFFYWYKIFEIKENNTSL